VERASSGGKRVWRTVIAALDNYGRFSALRDLLNWFGLWGWFVWIGSAISTAAVTYLSSEMSALAAGFAGLLALAAAPFVLLFVRLWQLDGVQLAGAAKHSEPLGPANLPESQPKPDLMPIREAAAALYQRTRLADRLGLKDQDERLRYHAEQLLSIARRGELVLHGRDLPAVDLEPIDVADLASAAWDDSLSGLRSSLVERQVRFADVHVEHAQIEPLAERLGRAGARLSR
jgi:hypothetical protein